MIHPFMHIRIRRLQQQGFGLSKAVGASVAACRACAAFAAVGDWSAPVTLSTPIPPTFYTASPVIAVNATGAHAAAWINESNYLLLQVAAQDSGASWTSAQTLSPATGYNAADPTIASSPNGSAVAMWDLYCPGDRGQPPSLCPALLCRHRNLFLLSILLAMQLPDGKQRTVRSWWKLGEISSAYVSHTPETQLRDPGVRACRK